MATSGTIATTTINTATLIEHALLRAKVSLSSQTPEVIQKAQENLYFLLLNLSNRGLNLWCVDKVFVGLVPGQSVYQMSAGTLDVLNVTHSQPTIVTSTFSAVSGGGLATLSTATSIVRVGFYFSASFTGGLTVKSSSDNVTYVTLTTIASDTYDQNKWYYVDLPVATNASYFSVTGTAAPVSNVRVISSSYDLPTTQWNRDTWVAINNKDRQSHPVTNYFFEKKIPPVVTVWPVPDSDTNYLMLYRHRQIQDVGTLTQQVEIPQRWLEGIIWQLCLRVVFEMPEADPSILQTIGQMADKYEFEAELGETDGAPMYLSPVVRGYTR